LEPVVKHYRLRELGRHLRKRRAIGSHEAPLEGPSPTQARGCAGRDAAVFWVNGWTNWVA